VLGDQWHNAIPVIQILAWVGIIQALQSLSVDVLMARGRSRTIFRFSLVLCSCHLLAFGVGLQWGVVGVAAGFAISTTLVEPFQSVLAARALGVSPMVLVRSVSGVFQAAIPTCALVLGLRLALVDAGMHEALRLIVCSFAGAVLYVGLCAWREPELAREARALIGRRRRRGAQSLAAPAAAVES
jgi:O-antigen/teichoic acid export membrane protein